MKLDQIRNFIRINVIIILLPTYLDEIHVGCIM